MPETPSTSHDPPIPADRLAPLNGRGHEKYRLMRAELSAVLSKIKMKPTHLVEPIELIRYMKHGHYRNKTRRGYPDRIVFKDDGVTPVGDRMSFREIAAELTTLTGVEVAYETVRRWWEIVFPDEPDEPAAEPAVEPVIQPLPGGRKRAATRRTPTPTPTPTALPVVSESTNPDVPVAAFLPPYDHGDHGNQAGLVNGG